MHFLRSLELVNKGQIYILEREKPLTVYNTKIQQVNLKINPFYRKNANFEKMAVKFQFPENSKYVDIPVTTTLKCSQLTFRKAVSLVVIAQAAF